MTSHYDFIRDTYDALVLDAGEDGVKISESRAAVTTALADAIRAGDVPGIGVDDYAHNTVTAVLAGVRDRRRASLPKLAELIRSVLAGDALLDEQWYPEVREAYALGTGDGVDKALIHWTADDWLYASITRYRKAAEATAAAAEFDVVATAIGGFIGGATTGAALGLI